MFFKICEFENHVTLNGIKMTSLPETIRKFGPLRKPVKFYIIRKHLIKLSKMSFLLNFSNFVKVMDV